MKYKSIFLLLLSSLFLFGCATGQNRESVKKLQSFVKTGNFNKALALAKGEKFYSEKRSKLLKLLEVGTVHYLNQSYFQALQSFDKAQNLSDKLFTVSIKGKLASAVMNSNMDNYYGEKYERATIRFYQALCHFMLYQKGSYEAFTRVEEKKNKEGKILIRKIEVKKVILSAKRKRTHLMGARASILNWDTLLESYRAVSAGEPTYKDDILAKVFGAFIHEQMGTRGDKQIAKKLYEKAKEILVKNFGIYPAFNKKYKIFKKDYKKFPQIGFVKVKKKYIDPTPFYKRFTKFIDYFFSRLHTINIVISIFIFIFI